MPLSVATPNGEPPGFQASLLEAVIVIDLESTVIYWNRFAETLYGWSSAEALGRNANDLLFPEQSEATRLETQTRLQHGQGWSGELVAHRRDGTSLPTQVIDSPLQDASGAIVGVISISFDVPTRKRAEQVQARLAAIVTSSGDAIIGIALDGNVTDWNAGAEARYGYTAAEVVGQSVGVLMPPEQLAAAPGMQAFIIGGGTLEQFDTVRVHKDGHRVGLPIRQSQLFDMLAHCLSASGTVDTPPLAAPRLAVPPGYRNVGRVLVVDDSPINQRVAVGLLKRLRFRAARWPTTRRRSKRSNVEATMRC